MSWWIHVQNLPPFSDELFLEDLLKGVGKMKDIVICKNPMLLKCNAFVEFFDEKHSKMAATRNDNIVIGQCAIRVFVVWSPSDTLSTIVVSNLPTEINKQEIEEHFLSCGDIVDIRIKKQKNGNERYALVSYSRIEYALQACQELKGAIVGNADNGLSVELLNSDARNLKWKRDSFEFIKVHVPSSERNSFPLTGDPFCCDSTIAHKNTYVTPSFDYQLSQPSNSDKQDYSSISTTSSITRSNSPNSSASSSPSLASCHYSINSTPLAKPTPSSLSITNSNVSTTYQPFVTDYFQQIPYSMTVSPSMNSNNNVLTQPLSCVFLVQPTTTMLFPQEQQSILQSMSTISLLPLTNTLNTSSLPMFVPTSSNSNVKSSLLPQSQPTIDLNTQNSSKSNGFLIADVNVPSIPKQTLPTPSSQVSSNVTSKKTSKSLTLEQQQLGNVLYKQLVSKYPSRAGKLVGMILEEQENISEIRKLIQHQYLLLNKASKFNKLLNDFGFK